MTVNFRISTVLTKLYIFMYIKIETTRYGDGNNFRDKIDKIIRSNVVLNSRLYSQWVTCSSINSRAKSAQSCCG